MGKRVIIFMDFLEVSWLYINFLNFLFMIVLNFIFIENNLVTFNVIFTRHKSYIVFWQNGRDPTILSEVEQLPDQSQLQLQGSPRQRGLRGLHPKLWWGRVGANYQGPQGCPLSVLPLLSSGDEIFTGEKKILHEVTFLKFALQDNLILFEYSTLQDKFYKSFWSCLRFWAV